MINITKIYEIAEQYLSPKKVKIESELKSRKKVLSRLAFLFSQLEREREKIYPTQGIKRTDIKSGINDALEKDEFSKYINEKEIENDFNKTIKHIEYINGMCENVESVKGYIKKNSDLLPFEYIETINQTQDVSTSNINMEILVGIIKGEHEFIALIEEMIQEIITAGALQKEEYEKLQSLMKTKIPWNKKLNEFAFLMNKLFNNQFIEIPTTGSSVVKSELLHAHFIIEGKVGKPTTERSLKDAFNNLSKKTKPDKYDELKKEIFK